MTSPRPPFSLSRFLLVHTLIGFGLGAAFVAWIIVQDVKGLGQLIMATDLGLFAAGMMWFFAGSTFSSAQMVFAVMMQGGEDDDHDSGYRQGDRQLVPVRIRPERRR